MPIRPLTPRPSTAVEKTAERWFAEEVQPLEPSLRAYLRRAFPTLDDADDVMQESFIRLWRAQVAGNVRSAKAFLFTVARHLAVDLFRHKATLRFELMVDNRELPVLAEAPDVAELVSRKQELEILREAIHVLPDRCRQVFTLRQVFGLSQKAIALKLGISEKTVERQLETGMKRCVAYLRRRGIPS